MSYQKGYRQVVSRASDRTKTANVMRYLSGAGDEMLASAKNALGYRVAIDSLASGTLSGAATYDQGSSPIDVAGATLAGALGGAAIRPTIDAARGLKRTVDYNKDVARRVPEFREAFENTVKAKRANTLGINTRNAQKLRGLSLQNHQSILDSVNPLEKSRYYRSEGLTTKGNPVEMLTRSNPSDVAARKKALDDMGVLGSMNEQIPTSLNYTRDELQATLSTNDALRNRLVEEPAGDIMRQYDRKFFGGVGSSVGPQDVQRTTGETSSIADEFETVSSDNDSLSWVDNLGSTQKPSVEDINI